MLPDKVAGELIIRAIAQHELDFIVWLKRVEIFERESIGLAGVRTLHVDDLDDWRGYADQLAFPAGLEQNFVTRVQQLLHERNDFAFLKHRFAAGNFDQSAVGAQPLDLS